MARKHTKAGWRRRRRKIMINRLIMAFVLIAAIVGLIMLYSKGGLKQFTSNNKGINTISQTLSNNEIIKVEYLTPNPYSRPQKTLRRINAVVIHYTANPGSTADNNRSYFEGLAESHITHASSHYIIGIDGEIVQCIPLTEISYASNNRNDDTISIECCHPGKTGKFTKKTYQSLVSLVAALCKEFDLDQKDIIRHYDVTGKLCPLYFVEHEDAWEKFKDDVMDEVNR